MMKNMMRMKAMVRVKNLEERKLLKRIMRKKMKMEKKVMQREVKKKRMKVLIKEERMYLSLRKR